MSASRASRRPYWPRDAAAALTPTRRASKAWEGQRLGVGEGSAGPCAVGATNVRWGMLMLNSVENFAARVAQGVAHATENAKNI